MNKGLILPEGFCFELIKRELEKVVSSGSWYQLLPIGRALQVELMERKPIRYLLKIDLNGSSRKSILSQARLYPEDVMTNESQIEHFWLTRNLKKNESVTKKLVSHETLIQEDKVSDGELKAIMERFKNL